MNDLLIYSLPANGLEGAVAVAKEIYSEMGMKPDEIRLSTGERVSYNWEHGEMSEVAYISKNKII